MSTSFFFSCEKEDTTPENKEENPIDMYPDSVSTMLFSCKIDGTVFNATSMVSHATSGIITAKGIKVSNGATVIEGTTQLTLSFGTNPSGELGTGNHECVGSMFETANSPDNKNKAIFKDVKINGEDAFAQPGGTISVEKYYESTYFQGAQGTFNNIKFYIYPAPDYELDSIMITDGVFNVKYSY